MSNVNWDLTRDLLQDPLKEGWNHVQTTYTGDNQLYPATVAGPYDPKTNTVPVIFHHGGNQPIRFPVRTQYQGPVPGTGSAFSLFKGQQVHVTFEMGQGAAWHPRGVIDLAYFTAKDRPAPRAATWANPKTTGGHVKVHPKDGKIGDVEHLDEKSNRYGVKIGETAVDDWGNQSRIQTGSSETQSAKKTREAAANMKNKAQALKGG